MKKSLIALLLTLALVMTMSVFAVSAEETATEAADYTLTVVDGVATAACPCPEHKGAVATFEAWTGMPANSTTAGSYHFYLAENYSVSGQKAFPMGNTVLHLNGNTYQRTNQGGALAAYADATVTILDNPENAGSIKDWESEGKANTWAGNGGIITLNNPRTTLNIYGGTYQLTESVSPGQKADLVGGIVGLGNAANVFNMYGGVFTGNLTISWTDSASTARTCLGGAVGVAKGTFNMYGGTIINSYASKGGAIYATSTSSNVNIYGGEIKDCSSPNGGAVYAHGGAKVAMSGGSISGCDATTIAGGVYVTSANSAFTMTGGTIEDCSSVNAGGVYVQDQGTLNLNGGEITGCFSTTGNGGGAYAAGSGKLYLNGTTISACVAGTGNTSGQGGALYNGINASGECKISGGEIKDCYATNRGGAISNKGVMTIEGGNIHNNYLPSNAGQVFGGQIYNESTTLNITGGTITKGNVPSDKTVAVKTTVQGGNICSRGGIVNISGANTVISDGSAQYGGNLYLGRNTHTIQDATISGGKASSNGGNIYVSDHASQATVVNIKNATISGGQAHRGGVIHIENNMGTVNVENSTLKDAKAGALGGIIHNKGGAITVKNSVISGGGPANATVTVDGGNIYLASGSASFIDSEIIGGTASQNGGNLYLAGGTLSISGGKITNGKATVFGGNVYLGVEGATIENCEILNGVAGTKLVDEETGEMVQPTSNGRGGNLAILAAAELTNCVIRNGEAYAMNPCGGNIYLQGTIGTDKQVTIDGCTITGGFGYYSGGNIQHHAAGTVVITGDSYIAEGKAGTMGGNIQLGVQAAAVLKIEGDTEINSKNSSASGNHGVNINVATTQQLYLGGNARIVSAKTEHSIAVAGAGTVHLSGNVYMNSYIALYAGGHVTDVEEDKVYAAGRVIAEEGFTGDVLLLTYYKNITGQTNKGTYDTVENWAVGGSTINFGAEAPAYLQAGENYDNTGTIKVHSKGRSGYVTAYADGQFVIAPYTAYTVYDPEAADVSAHVEHGLANFSALPEGTAKVKLYKADAITLTEVLDGVVMDMNNQAATITTNGYTFKPMNYRSDDITKAIVPFTVDGEIELVVQDPMTNYQYLNVLENGKWTSNRVRVELTKVSIRTTNAGIYYTTKIATNKNAAPYIKDFGTAVTVADVESIGANFMERLAEDGILYTATTLAETDKFEKEARSALISGILSTENDAATNIANAETAIVANSYVTAIVDGKEVKIMADEGSKLTYKEVIIKLNDAVNEWNIKQPTGYAANIATAANFYNTWADVFSGWDLEYLKAEAAKVA